jgi:tRNA (guanine37-N1)-methyltransferase
MRFDIVTLFPELFDAPLKHGITRRAFQTGVVQVQLWPLRDFADDAIAASTTAPMAVGRAW